MKISEFTIGQTFWTGARKWRCTDVCCRFVAAIELHYGADPRDYAGPIYGVVEYAFGLSQLDACIRDLATPDDLDKWKTAEKERLVTVHGISDNVEVPYSLSVIPEPEGMEYQDFAIGELFLLSAHVMRCVDIGTRVVVACDICHANERLEEAQGEPFSHERVLDEFDIGAATALYCLSDEELTLFREGEGGFRRQIRAMIETRKLKQL
jgi:hypothetical protein